MIVPWLIFIAVGLMIYSGFLKLAARLLRYSVSWKVGFLFACIVMVAIIVDHVIVFSQPVAIRVGQGVVLLVGLVILGSWFFSSRGTDRRGTVLGWSGALRLMALMFSMMIAVTFAIAIPLQIFLSKNLLPPP